MSRPTENVDEDQVVRSAGGDFGLRRLSRRILKRRIRPGNYKTTPTC